jgi:hypothetical protein
MLDTDLLDEVELTIQEIDVFLFAFQNRRE